MVDRKLALADPQRLQLHGHLGPPQALGEQMVPILGGAEALGAGTTGDLMDGRDLGRLPPSTTHENYASDSMSPASPAAFATSMPPPTID